MKPRLLLHCDAGHSVFTLAKQGENWRRQFPDLRAALEYATSIVTDETPLIVFNELGRVIVESVISPKAPSGGVNGG